MSTFSASGLPLNSAVVSNVPFVFLGSVRNRMHEIFDSPKSPFFKSAISFPVDKIDEGELAAFLQNRFSTGDRRVSPEVARLIVEKADGIFQGLATA